MRYNSGLTAQAFREILYGAWLAWTYRERVSTPAVGRGATINLATNKEQSSRAIPMQYACFVLYENDTTRCQEGGSHGRHDSRS